MKRIGTAILIDDNTIDQRLYKKILMRSDLVGEVITFSLAGPALDFLRENRSQKIDVIFLDIIMPMMDGFEFLDRLRSNPQLRDLKAIVSSASVAQSDRKMS